MFHSAGSSFSSKLERKLVGSFLMLAVGLTVAAPFAQAMGVITQPTLHIRVNHAHPHVFAAPVVRRKRVIVAPKSESKVARSTHERTTRTAARKTAKTKKAPITYKPLAPQAFADKLVSQQIAPGVMHRYFRGPLSINLIDIDMKKAPVKVQPFMAGDSFDRLKDVAQHAREANAIAAVNANYFKKNGTPLGTMIIDGEWISGPLYDRVSMGITKDGDVRIDRVSFGGTLTSDNPDLPQTWVNNINQPRRSGCHLFAYTKRWGNTVKLPYEGCLVAVNAQGKVSGKALSELSVPTGGYVLSDSKNAPISKLNLGDTVKVDWQTRPGWDDVVQAVSGGPMLIKDGNLFLDLKDENFKRGWTGSQIKARTVAGVTVDNHLLLATIEGPHTLWDVAKFLRGLGAVDALNLDGGGSTTMVVAGRTVTRNANAAQRHVAASIVVLDMRTSAATANRGPRSVFGYPEEGTVGAQVAAPTAPINDADNAAGSTVQIEGITAPPAQTVDVDTKITPAQVEPAPKKKKHFFGLL